MVLFKLPIIHATTLDLSRSKSILSLCTFLLLITLIPTFFLVDLDWLNLEEYQLTISNSLPSVLKSCHENPLTKPLSEIIIPGQHDQLADLFDPRLPIALSLTKLKHHIQLNNGFLDPDFVMPFHWADWIDMKSKLDISPEDVSHGENKLNFQGFRLRDITPKQFISYFDCDNDQEFMKMTVPISKSYSKNYPLLFAPTYDTAAKFNAKGRILYGAAYLYAVAPAPERLHFLDSGPDGSSVVVPAIRNDDLDLLEDVIGTEAKLSNKSFNSVLINGFKLDRTLDQIKSTFSRYQAVSSYDNLEFDDSYLLKLDKDYNRLNKKDFSIDNFIWHQDYVMDSLQSQVSNLQTQDSPKLHKSFDKKLLTTIKQEIDSRDGLHNHEPFLHEAKMIGTTMGDHYDWRFFNGCTHSREYRQAVIHRMGRAWLRFCYQSGLTTYMAYGSMLGWIKNGLTLPWDEDIDVIVTMDSMYKLAKFHNQSLIIDLSSGDGSIEKGLGSYLIDIGVSFYDRVKGNGANVIDGRFIDTQSGIYTDITALAWTEDYLQQQDEANQVVENLITPGSFGKMTKDEVLAKAKEKQENKQLLHCRNDNIYRFDEITPMVPTLFEGVRTLVPFRFVQILHRKYPGAIDRLKESSGFSYWKDIRLWTPNEVCELDQESDQPDELTYDPTVDSQTKEGERAKERRMEPDGVSCLKNHRDVRNEFELTKKYTEKHSRLVSEDDLFSIKLNLKDESGILLHDEFILDYAERLGIEI